MSVLKLKLDPSGIESGSRRAKGALRGVGNEAHRTESAVDRMAKKSGTSVAGLAARFGTMAAAAIAATAVLGFFKSVISEQVRYETNMRKIEAVIKSTGGAAGKTSAALEKQAHSLALGTLASIDDIQKAQTVLLTFRHVTGDTFDSALKGALALSAAMGTDLKSSILQLGKALDDPILGMTALSRSGTGFTDEQKALVKSMVDVGNVAGAQALILNELSVQYGDVAFAAGKGLAGAMDELGQRWVEFKLAVGKSSEVASAAQSILGGLSAALVWLAKNINRVVKVFGFLSTALAPIISGFRQLIGFAFDAATYLGLVGSAADTIKQPTDAAANATAGLNTALGTFSTEAAPTSSAQAIILATHNRDLARSAIAAAEAELSKTLALQASYAADKNRPRSLVTLPGDSLESQNQKAFARKIRESELKLAAAGHRLEAAQKALENATSTGGVVLLGKVVADTTNKLKKLGGGFSKVAKVAKTEIPKATSQITTLGDAISTSMGDGLLSMADGTKTVSEAFRVMAADIIKELYRVIVVQRAVAGIKQAFGGISGGGIFNGLFGGNGLGSFFHSGGVVGQGGVSRPVPAAAFVGAPRMHSGGIAGLRSDEVPAILQRGERVLSRSETRSSGGGGNITINQTFTGGVTQGDLGRMIPKIVEASKAAVLQARKQGGSYAHAFGG